MEYCTILDAGFLPRVVALAASLHASDPRMRLWALCADDAAKEALGHLGLPGVTPIAIAELEAAYPQLVSVRPMRSPYEYLMTCKPWLLRFLLETKSDASVLAYLDADLFFFGDPGVIETELGDASVLLTPHRFPASWTKGLDHGTFNAGFVALRNDDRGKAAARHWGEQTLAWCRDIVEDGKFIDQKYLDAFPRSLEGVRVSEHAGLNLAPWNLGRHVVRVRDGYIIADDAPLIFYHFHGLRRLRSWLLDLGLAPYRVIGNPILLRDVYRPYLHALRNACDQLRAIGVDAPPLRTVRDTVNAPVTPGLLLARLRRRQWLLA